ncbi:MAG: bacterioferritin, partial [Polyangiaceae bacterium]|nr:bacterioferritin [Polyangiaceae bacterium]
PAAQVGSSPVECLKVGLEMETLVSKKLNQLIALCTKANDAGTRTLGDKLLYDTEMDHILWLEQQLGMIEKVGEENYLVEQIGKIG